jgi:hypothetical protein
MVTTEEKKVQSTPEEKNPKQGTLILNYVQFDYTTLQTTDWKLYMKMYKMCSSPEIKSDDFENG